MKLVIDGNFFSNRIRSALGLTFIDDPELDKQTLLFECTRSLCSELRRLPGIDKIIIGRDWGSWRKHFEQVYPLGQWKDEEVQTYKANRDVERNYDAAAFFAAYDAWIELLETKLNIPVIKAPKTEADDICALAAQGFAHHNLDVVLWTSDGDYIQNLSKNIFLLKFPKRQLWADLALCGQKSIFSLNENANFNLLCENFKKEDIVFENPIKSIFKKIVYGDGKDNVPPTFFWLNAKGGRRRPSESFIDKALEELGINIDALERKHLYDEQFIKEFFMMLLWVTKQTPAFDHKPKSRKTIVSNQDVFDLYENVEAKNYLDHCLKVYDSNRKMKLLDTKQIPENIKTAIYEQLTEKLKMKHDVEVIKDFNKAAKMMGIGEPAKKDSYFSNFNLTEVKQQVEKPAFLSNPVDDLLNDIMP